MSRTLGQLEKLAMIDFINAIINSDAVQYLLNQNAYGKYSCDLSDKPLPDVSKWVDAVTKVSTVDPNSSDEDIIKHHNFWKDFSKSKSGVEGFTVKEYKKAQFNGQKTLKQPCVALREYYDEAKAVGFDHIEMQKKADATKKAIATQQATLDRQLMVAKHLRELSNLT